MKYILNPILFLSKEKNSFYFINKMNGKKFEINKTLYDFLKLLETEITYENLLSKYKELLKLDNIEHIVKVFFDDALKKTLIIQQNEFKDEITINRNENFENLFYDERFSMLNILYQSKKSIIYKLINSDNKEFIFKTKFDVDGNVLLEDLQYEIDMHKSLNNFNFIPALFEEKLISNGIVCEFIDGFNLNRKNIQNFSEKTKKLIFENVLRNYQYLENIEFFHGDIHIGNIICNENFNVYLLDFGESFYENKNIFNKNAANHYFTPPERIGNNIFKKFKSSTSRYSEIYQLSLILYYLFYNQMPFKGFTWKELRNNILEAKVETDENISKEINDFILTGLNRDPLNRFNNINEMYEIFKKI